MGIKHNSETKGKNPSSNQCTSANAYQSKRAAALAMVNSLANCTHLFTSYLYPNSAKPRYVTAGITLSLFCGLCAVTAMLLRFWLRYENRKMDKAEAVRTGDEEVVGGRETGFRYLL